MINSMQRALIMKDFQSIVSNKRLFSVLLVVPLVFTVIMPSIFVLTTAFLPDDLSDFQPLIESLPTEMVSGSLSDMVIELIFNNIMPVFFLLIPIMAASVMAASSFVGEKEKRTLETLLYSPLSLKKIFQAKIAASFLMSMAVSAASFLAMTLVVEVELHFFMGRMVLPGANWPILLLLVSPAISLIAITIIVRGSAKARTMEESQQRSVFLILPVILLASGQFSGLIFVSPYLLLALGIALAAAAAFAMRRSAARFTHETLLR